MILVFFLFLHLTGIVYAGIYPKGFEIYVSSLHSNIFLPFLEIGLAFTFMIHIFLTIQKSIQNHSNGNTAFLKTRRSDSLGVLTSKIQPLTGIILTAFLILHLSQLRFPRPEANLELTFLKNNLESIHILLLYWLGAIALCFHMIQGIESAHRSIGILNKKNSLKIRNFGRLISIFFGILFCFMSYYLRLD